MGTRGSYGFTNGKLADDKVTYNHFDSYPDGLGAAIFNFLLGETPESLRDIAGSLRMVTEDDKPTDEQKQKCADAKTIDTRVGNQSPDDWYCLLRKRQGDLAMHRDVGVMIDSRGFLYDSLFCEWAYVYNTETEKLEVYRGFNKDPDAAGRYARPERSDEDGWCGVRLIMEVPLGDLQGMEQQEFVDACHEAGQRDRED